MRNRWNRTPAEAGIIGMTRAMAKEWGRYKVNVNCMAFGLIDTRMAQPLACGKASIHVGDHEIPVGIHKVTPDMLNSSVPLGRPGTPQEAAGAVCLFCMPELDYISGQATVCSGGLRA